MWLAVNKLTVNIINPNDVIFRSHMYNKKSIKIAKLYYRKSNDKIALCIDKLINEKAHIPYVQSKLPKGTAMMHICSHLLHRNSKCILYNSFFFPYLNYYVEIWEYPYPTHTNNIVLLQ